MSIRSAVRVFVVAAIVLMPGTAPGQESSLIPTFPALVIRKHENGHLVASFSREADTLTMTVRSNKVPRPEDGWGGVCLENRVPVNLLSYAHMSATIDPSAPVVMDVKLEKTKAEEGTIVLADKEPFPRGRKTYAWTLKDAGSGTLAETKKLCVFVLSDDFPRGANQVTVAIGRIRFDRR